MLPCFVCRIQSNATDKGGGNLSVNCPRCGSFEVSDVASALFKKSELQPRTVANLSGFLRENPGFSVTKDNFERVTNLPTPPVSEKAEKLLFFLSRRFPSPGEVFRITRAMFSDGIRFFEEGGGTESARTNAKLHVDLISVAWALSGEEVSYLVLNYLASAKGWLEVRNTCDFTISADGWEFLEVAKPNKASPFAFVAMNFDPKLRVLFDDGIDPAVKAAGYSALRVDQHEHVNRIDDEIIAQLRRCRFCVADLTGQKNGVYFEAGYALGFNIPVIWSCSKTELKLNKVHFDTRQYNILVWKPGELADFQKRLSNRIEAVIGSGPRAQIG